MSETYYLLDARAAYDVGKAIVCETGTDKEVCKTANDGTHGKDAIPCRLVSGQFEPMWHWFCGKAQKWIPRCRED